MHARLIPLFLLASAAPAFAAPDREDPLEREIRRAVPAPERIEAMTPVLDHALFALLSIDIGPILDAADPAHRRADHGRPGRTLREMATRDDPAFEQRLRSGLHRSTEEAARVSGAVAAAAPAIAHSIRAIEQALVEALARTHTDRD